MVRKQDLLELLEEQPGACVSLYMPTHRSAPETEQDPIRFKNLLRSIENELVNKGTNPTDARNLLERAEKLRDDASFWSQQSGGLACFNAPNYFRVEQAPVRFEPQYHVLDRFYIRPLLSLLTSHERFFILALSQETAQLYEATPHSIAPITLKTLPKGVESLQPDRRIDETLQHHTGELSTPKQVSAVPIYHGHAVSAGNEEVDILRYLREVDRVVYANLKDENAPLVLACVGFLASLYESANSYKHMTRAKVPGNPEIWSEEELLAKAHEIVKPHLNQQLQSAQEKHSDAPLTPMTSTNIEEIVRAANDGRVETLFVAKKSPCLGRSNSEIRSVELASEAKDDLIDVAAGKTLQSGGTVFAVDDAPRNQPMAATFRYALAVDQAPKSN